MAVCGAAIFVNEHVVSGTNVVLACAFVVEGAVSISQSVSMAFSSFVASVTVCLAMASCHCLMAEMRQSVADISGSGI